ncbi:MAG: zf-TFIIB domain-containing protein [Betaproteobacteria bacterium]
MTKCPNCYSAMDTQTMEVHTLLGHVEIDACRTCRLLWFDAGESISLTPRAVLDLFQYVAASTVAPTPLASRFSCPRCQNALLFTNDLQRTTRFTYWRCDIGHGRLISFNQFLREKNFIRTPSPPELARLRAIVKQISCSQCGAPVDLAKDSACSHCGAPIALVDPDGVAKAIQELRRPQAAGAAGDASVTRQALGDAQIEALVDLERMRERGDDADLLLIGLQAVGGLVGAFLSSR